MLLSLHAELVADPARATAVAVDDLEPVIASLPGEMDPDLIVRTGRASLAVDRMAGCRESHWRIVHAERPYTRPISAELKPSATRAITAFSRPVSRFERRFPLPMNQR